MIYCKQEHILQEKHVPKFKYLITFQAQTQQMMCC